MIMHILSMKGKTKKKSIQAIEDAPFLYIPLAEYLGCAPTPVVNVGDKIKKYQLIGEVKDKFATKVHAPVSGVILETKDYPFADGSSVKTIVIQNDYKDEEVNDISHKDYNQCSPEELIERIKDAGIVGQGGAQFPTAIKYSVGEHKIHTFIVNGAECEPYLTSDYSLMAERTEELFKGIDIIKKILNADNVIIGIEHQNRELLKVFAPYLQQEEHKGYKAILLPDQYPQGGELQLIKSATGIELPRSKRPAEAGIIVSNIGTIYSVYQAVVNHKPVISRIITISGERSTNYGNYEVKIGTPIRHITKSLGIETSGNTIIQGGPMMGKAIQDLSIPVTKGASGILFLKKEEVKRSNCISCGYCVDVCPMRLMPMKFEENYRKKKYFNLEKYSISSCIECAACEYICPSNVPLIESIKEGKVKLKELANAIR